MDVFVARQPIFDRGQKVVAYEILYRSKESDTQAEIANPDEATTEVFRNTFMEIGLDQVAGSRRAFINLTRPFLMGEQPLPFSHENVTLEVLEDVIPDENLIQSVQRLSNRGYTIALDDFIFRKELLPLIKIADIIKIDIRQLSKESLEKHVELLKRFDLELLAEKVETRDEFKHCMDLGFDYFQGYFFCQPLILKGKQANPSKLASFRLLQKINDPNFNFDELTELISMDATLAYKLLRYINSAFFGLRKEVDSIRHALILLGQKNIRMWLNLIAISQVKDANRELMVLTLMRAKMGELLADSLGRGSDKEKYFLAGLFSAIESFVDMPLAEILESIALSDDIKQGLLNREGPVGEVLDLIYKTEQGAWADLDPLGLSADTINNAYLEAVSWSGEIMQLFAA